MPALFIIDQSLTDVGGHHFDYTRLVAQAAKSRGLTPVIGTNRALKPNAEKALEGIGQVEKVWRETTYTKLSHLAGLRELTQSRSKSKAKGNSVLRPVPGQSKWKNWKGVRAQKNRMKSRARLIRQFAEDCDIFFRQFSFEDGDQVFFTTVSDLEFMGLAAFLSSHPRTMQARWNVQFHFSIFEGRPEEFERQSYDLGAATNGFQSALARVPYHDIRGYTTSEELAEQYNRLRVLNFEEMPYPINPQLFENNQEKKKSESPMTMTVAGGVRREKGQKTYLASLVDSIWDHHVEPGQLKMNIQSGDSRLFTKRQVLTGTRQRSVSEKQFKAAVKLYDHPLPDQDYLKLIAESDIGLVYYDSRRYFARRAGVLGEFLAAGKPVIVPAGCWLAKQISEPGCQYIDHLMKRVKKRSAFSASELNTDSQNVPSAGGIISFDRNRTPFHCMATQKDIELDRTTGVAVSFEWRWPATYGSFVEVTLNQRNAGDQIIHSEKQIVTMREMSSRSLAWFPLDAEMDSCQFEFRNAWLDQSLSVSDVTLDFVDLGDTDTLPRSAVGLIVPDESFLQEAVDEIVNHYDHYRSTAAQFARQWAYSHHPLRTIEQLIPESDDVRKAA